jgi:hypothetical protein
VTEEGAGKSAEVILVLYKAFVSFLVDVTTAVYSELFIYMQDLL